MFKSIETFSYSSLVILAVITQNECFQRATKEIGSSWLNYSMIKNTNRKRKSHENGNNAKFEIITRTTLKNCFLVEKISNRSNLSKNLIKILVTLLWNTVFVLYRIYFTACNFIMYLSHCLYALQKKYIHNMVSIFTMSFKWNIVNYESSVWLYLFKWYI